MPVWLKLLPLVLRSLLRKRLRTSLTLAAILFPVVVIAMIGTFVRALRFDPARQTGIWRVVTRHKVGLTTPIPGALVRSVEPLPGVLAVTTLDRFGGIYVDTRPRNSFPRFGTDPVTLLRVFDDLTIVDGTFEAWRSDRSGCLVGEKLMARQGWRLGGTVTLKGNIYPVDLTFTIRAVYRLPYESSGSLFFDRRALEEAYPPYRGSAITIWSRCRDGAAAERLPGLIDAMTENSAAPTKSETENAFQLGFVSLLGNVEALFTSLTTVLVCVVILIAANTVALSTRERTVEIAVFRAIGFTRLHAAWLVLGEGLLLSLVGGVLGLGSFALVFPRLKAVLLDTRLAAFAAGMQLYPGVMAAGVAVSLLIGVAAAVVPAVRAARRPIVDGFREV